MFKNIAIIILFFLSFLKVQGSDTFYVKEKFLSAQPGDYIVTFQGNTYSLLLIHSLRSDILLLEEISIPSQQINPKTLNWSQWLREKAPGHTAWTFYEIDLKKGQLIECFSCSKKGWVHLDEQEQFLAKLFTLSFRTIPYSQRKKMGPPPSSGEEDHRKVWNPSLVIQGKKIVHPSFEVIHTQWPMDDSPLSGCEIALYFDAQDQKFPFPHWIECQSAHYTFKIHSIDSGKDLSSPMAIHMPHRPPECLKLSKKTPSSWILSFKAALYHDSIRLFVRDLTAQKQTLIPIPCRLERKGNKEEAQLLISIDDLKKMLEIDHSYQWILFSEKTPEIYVKSEEAFLWKSSYEQGFPQNN